MKATLDFDLNEPEDEMALKRCIKSKEMAILIFEISHNMEKYCYNICESNDDYDKYKGVDTVFDRIYQIISDLDININELID